MNVELAKPFQWPELPDDKQAWSNQLFQMREDMMEERNNEHIRRQRFEIPLKSKEPVTKQRKQLADLAKQMLSGEVKWENDVVLDPKWDKILAEREAKKSAENTSS